MTPDDADGDPDGPGSGDRAVAAAAERAKATAARNIPAFPVSKELPLPADTANLREGANLHDGLLALLPLVGVWRGEGIGHGGHSEHSTHGDYRFGQQIVVSHDGGDYLNWEARSWRLTETGEYDEPALRETGFWRFVSDPGDPSESQAIELLLAHSTGYVELFYGRPRTATSWELVTDALARSKSEGLIGPIGPAKRLYGIVEGGDLAYLEERVDADGGLVPHLSARLTRFVG